MYKMVYITAKIANFKCAWTLPWYTIRESAESAPYPSRHGQEDLKYKMVDSTSVRSSLWDARGLLLLAGK